jgi:hypothetical protein
VIQRYTAFLRPRRIPYSSIRSVTKTPLSHWRKWRLWGSGDFKHWFNLDPRRPRKEIALVVDVGKRVEPVVTPDDPQQVVDVLRRHGVQVIEPV